MSYEGYLDAATLRRALGISTATYHRWLREGKLRGVRAGRKWRFPKNLVEELLRKADPDVDEARRICLERLGREEGGVTDNLAHLLIEHALRRRATDLHIDPVADGVGIRERIHGVLAPLEPPLPAGALAAVMQSVRTDAKLDAGAAGPQTGRFFFPFEGRRIDVRASTYPTGLGPAVTLRLLDPAEVTVDLDALGFDSTIVKRARKLLRCRRGVFVVNGPTGTGKSTTLYCLLSELAAPNRKVMTIEDPVELHLDGMLQANVGPEMDFRDAMYAMLRNDVDTGMVSELRDAETIRLLFQTANTGHLMLSAMHAPDAVSVLHRLLAIGGVEPRLLVENLLGVLDQRLLELSCHGCRTARCISKEDAGRLGLAGAERRRVVSYNEGCEECRTSGVSGREAVGELLTLEGGLRAAVEAGTSAPEELVRLLPEEHRGLRDAVLDRLFAGEVTPRSAIACCG